MDGEWISVIALSVEDYIEIGYSGVLWVERVRHLPTGDIEIWARRKRHSGPGFNGFAHYVMAETAKVKLIKRSE